MSSNPDDKKEKGDSLADTASAAASSAAANIKDEWIKAMMELIAMMTKSINSLTSAITDSISNKFSGPAPKADTPDPASKMSKGPDTPDDPSKTLSSQLTSSTPVFQQPQSTSTSQSNTLDQTQSRAPKPQGPGNSSNDE